MLKWSDDVQEILTKYVDKKAQKNKRRKRKDLPSSDDFMFKTKPFDHQKRAFYLSRDKKNFALLMEQGTLKTKVIIDSAAYLYANGAIDLWLLLHLMVFIETGYQQENAVTSILARLVS